MRERRPMGHAPDKALHFSFAEALLKGPAPTGALAVPVFAHGSLQVKIYTPSGSDTQRPHDQDEVYFVARGTGRFFDGAESYDVGVGDLLFVAARQPHRFEQFSSDFAVWVIFYGPVGGEAGG
jgi:mannose-6-phosphate isomerase-like protein (cupin superfamily)